MALSFPMATLDPHFITALEVQYWMTGDYPSKKSLMELFGLSEAQYQEQISLSLEPLKTRGLDIESLLPPTPVNERRPQNGLDPFFVLAVNAICDTMDKRSIPAKLKDVGMTSKKFQGFLAKDDHFEYYSKRVGKVFTKTTAVDAQAGLARNVAAGDLHSIKYYNEVTGIYRPNEQLTVNIGIIIGKIMEVLASHVTADVLALVADQLEEIVISESETKELVA